jgi:hypothetical protein
VTTLPWLWAAFASLAAILGLLIAMGGIWGSFTLLAIFLALLFLGVGVRMRSEKDANWLPKWVLWGFLVKVAGTVARYLMVTVLYGAGDSYRYYRVGVEIAEQLRRGQLPEFTEQVQGGFGTQVVEFITGGLFYTYTPDLLSGFLIFATFAFVGQLLLYAAFRHWAGPGQLKPYAFLVFFLPTYAFWPSSIGKDALVIFVLGASAYFAARVLRGFELRHLIGLAAALTVLGLIRVHIAGLVVIALIGAGLISRMPEDVKKGAVFRRLVVVGSFIAAGVVVLTVFPEIFGVDLTAEGSIESFTSDVVRRTSEDGTVASGDPVTGPLDVPGAVVLALFRPLASEATEIQHLFAAAETTFLLGLTIWKLPHILRSWRNWRPNGYIVFSTVYVIGYAIAFSVVRNLGIIARQRGQVLAFFLCVLIGLGWPAGRSRDRSKRDLRASSLPSAHREAPPPRHPEKVR